MKKVTNISTGARGAYLNGVLVMAEPGETIEADDFIEEWFKVEGKAKTGKAPNGPTNDDILSAVGLLDHANDEHWTEAGLPSVEAMKEALGGDVTRAQIEAAAPDAKRKTD